MEQALAIELLGKTQALLEGHFLLTSGKHSKRYVQCAQLLSHPEVAGHFMRDIAAYFGSHEIDLIAAPAVGGIIVSWEIGRLLHKRAIFLERENGIMSLRRGFGISRGERVLIVEDVITTGSSVLEISEVVRNHGAVVTAYSSIVNRSAGRFNPGESYYFCVDMDIPIYLPEQCPLCKQGIPLVKPGSRSLA
jgi:orotate phosphoribosyltransferase